MALSKRLTKDDTANKVKHDNDLVYSSVHNSDKYSVPSFNEISPLDSKFDTLNKFYKDFEKLKGAKSQTKERKQKRITVLRNTFMIYDVFVRIYKKRRLDVKMKTGGKTWFKNQPQQSDHSILPTLVKAAKSRFNEIQSIITEAKKIRLVTTINKKFITLNDGEKLLESIISGKNYKSEAREMYNDIADGANAMNR